MSFTFRNDWMAQALSVVAEHGVHGMEYNALVDQLIPSRFRTSKRLRYSPRPSHKFSASEFEEYMILAWRWGLVERSEYKEVDWVSGKNKGSYSVEDEILRLTEKGWLFIGKYDQPTLHRWLSNIRDNLPSVVISALSALAAAWLLHYVGASQMRPGGDSTLENPECQCEQVQN